MTEQQNWQPTTDIKTLKRRAQLLADVRRFFAARDVLEVDTPILSQAAPTATYLDSFNSLYQPPGGQTQTYYLQTSPEFAMKRLLAAGSGDIYQIAKVFRNGELGRLHNPEFTMLEWYRPALDYAGLMQEVDELLQQVAAMPAATKMPYHEAFQQYLELDIEQADEAILRQTALSSIPGLPDDWQTDRDGWLEMLLSELIEPELAKLNQPVIIYDFPASQAQLAKVYQNQDGIRVAARFEVYAGGLELANGYDECLDAAELKARFEDDNRQRQQRDKPVMPIDKRLLAAIENGLPPCTGVALGLERLMMLVSDKTALNEVLSFGFERS
jgi:lysyl-tRNA synthetase class 2